MSGQKDSIRDLVQRLAEDTSKAPNPIPCKVLSVNEEERTCDVEPVDGSAEVFDVRLQVSQSNTEGLVIIPKVDSLVLVVFYSNTLAFVASGEQHSKILIDCEEVVFNGGENGALLNAPAAIAELVKTTARLEALVGALNSFASTQSAASAPSPLTPLAAGFTTLQGALSALPAGGDYNEAQLTDETVKH